MQFGALHIIWHEMEKEIDTAAFRRIVATSIGKGITDKIMGVEPKEERLPREAVARAIRILTKFEPDFLDVLLRGTAAAREELDEFITLLHSQRH